MAVTLHYAMFFFSGHKEPATLAACIPMKVILYLLKIQCFFNQNNNLRVSVMILFRHLQNEYVVDFLKLLQFAYDYQYYLQKAQQLEAAIAENVQ